MPLHHRPHVRDMRQAYCASVATSTSDHSNQSERSATSSSHQSHSTHHTQLSSESGKRHLRVHYGDCGENQNLVPDQPFFDDRLPEDSPRTSVASTIESEAEDPEIESHQTLDPPAYKVPPRRNRVLVATPADFTELFPSRRNLLIRHDDSTPDGHMNLRVDTEVSSHGQTCDMTLFHLRLQDLQAREFSFRRYCRDSGREICHTSRKQQKTGPKRPGFQRSLSNVLNSMSHRTKSEPRAETLGSLKRNDSGYGSMQSVQSADHERPRTAGHDDVVEENNTSNDTIKLEFSNYAQVALKRVGAKGSKRYEFEYWGTAYAWRRTVRKQGAVKEVSFSLTKDGQERALALITPLRASAHHAEAEKLQGAWVPACTLQLEDRSLVHGQRDVLE
ncbi:hypothetical protein LTR62_003023 [Meristemomyces frigidus]|uniref:Uncharacterized protein n=1 Tax=Meristemomyces frigidus TaxID=1508187 RepID=A0AAN7TS64_9PEZI|nr:hypothetical protein LTR62_003023 [Meristemomyces frigidus]